MINIEHQLHDFWEYIVRELPDNLDDSAMKNGALLRRKGVDSAVNLLRIILTYGVTDLSFKAVSAWATALKIGELSSVAIFYRIRDAQKWLSYLIATILNNEAKPLNCTGLKITIVDATVITGTGSTGTDWRLHTEIDPSSGHITAVKLTDNSIGENYKHYPVTPESIVVGDRAYALATGIAYVHQHSGYVVARANLNSIRICRLDRTVFNPKDEGIDMPKTGVVRHDILIPTPPATHTRSHKPWKLKNATGWIPARLLAMRTIKNTIIWIITTVPDNLASDEIIMELYRVRWQIELEFKRLKSLLHLDALPTRNGPTAASWILARILAAILIEKLLRTSEDFSPWGYRLYPG